MLKCGLLVNRHRSACFFHGWNNLIHIYMVWFTRNFSSIVRQSHKVFLHMYNAWVMCIRFWLVLTCTVGLLLHIMTSDLSAWLMMILIPMGIFNFLSSLLLAGTNPSTSISVESNRTLTSTSVTLMFGAWAGLLCAWWCSRQEPLMVIPGEL